NFLQVFGAHVWRNDVAEACHVGVPLTGELVGLNVVFVFALRVVTKVFAVPEFLDVTGLGFGEFIVILLRGGGFAKLLGNFFGRTQSGEIKAGGIGALAFDEPGVVGLVRIALVFGQAVAVAIVL